MAAHHRARHVAAVRAQARLPLVGAVVVVRLKLGAPLIERERVTEHANGRV